MRSGSWRAAALAAFALGCGTPVEKKAAPAVSEYADPKVCAGCHGEIARNFQLTGMGRSITSPSQDNPVEDFARRNTLLHRPSESTYTMIRRGGEIYQRRHQSGFDGRETNVDEHRADFVIGSGNHARSYLSHNREGKYIELPVSWYAAKGGYWEMSPGYDRADQEDFRRVVPDECFFCHSSYAAPLQAIDCQRCHGPGRAHAESAGRAAIVNPKKLSRDRQLDICMQCHLETTSSPLPNAIRRFERAAFSYRPGEPLGEFAIYFDHASGAGYDGKFEIAHAAYRLRKSECFKKSAMTCSTCHDPHRSRRGAEAARCSQCHAAPHHADTTCIDCHMPKRRTGDAVNVWMTDHLIQRRPAAEPGAAPKTDSYRGVVALYYPESLPPSAENEAYLAVAQVQHGANLADGIPRLDKAIARLAPARPEFYFELAKAYSKNGDEEAAVKRYEDALRRQADFQPAIKGLAASLLALRRFDRAAEVLATARNPDARMLTNHGQALLESGKVNEAAQMLERGLAANPELPETHDLLGLACLRRGDEDSAARGFREAIRLRPDLASAHANLAGLLTGRKDLAQAQYHFRKALAFDPNAAETHRSYAYLLILMQNYRQARSEFEAAVRLDPKRPHARIDLAELDLAEGKPAAAAAQYGLALKEEATFAEAHYGLGKLLLAQGKAAEARAHLEKAAETSDPTLRQLALQALAVVRDRR